MFDVLEQSRGAAKFTASPQRGSTVSDATMFTSGTTDDCVDDVWDSIVDRLRGLRSLENEWDGDAAVAPDDQVIETAIALAARLKECSHPAPSRVVPGVNGTVAFEFVGEYFFEIDVISATTAEVYEDGECIGRYEAEG